MNADNRYFMSSVKILRAINDLQRAKESLENNVPLSAASSLRNACILMVETIEDVMTKRLSDKSHEIPRGCDNKCGWAAERHVCGRSECIKCINIK